MKNITKSWKYLREHFSSTMHRAYETTFLIPNANNKYFYEKIMMHLVNTYSVFPSHGANIVKDTHTHTQEKV